MRLSNDLEETTLPHKYCHTLGIIQAKEACMLNFDLATDPHYQSIALSKDSAGIIAINYAKLLKHEGQFKYQEIDILLLIKLQVFIDKFLKNSVKFEKKTHPILYIPFAFSTVTIQPQQEIMYWLVEQAIGQTDIGKNMMRFLRQSPFYSIIEFLFSAASENITLQALAKQYGLSYSHFRRICRKILGGSIKHQLRDWRAIQALLHFVKTREKMTYIASYYGYASTAHFSNDIKQLLGTSPCKLRSCITND